MPVYLEDSFLSQYIIAVILRESGYIAGVPRRLLYGRTMGHEVNVVAIERCCSPFSFHNVIIPKVIISENSSEQLKVFYNLKSILSDLENTLPQEVEVLPDFIKGSSGEFFHRFYCNSQQGPEELSVSYKGIVFAFTKPKKNILNYANANGIFVIYLPRKVAGKDFFEWIALLKKELKNSLQNNLLAIKSLKNHTRKQSDYRQLLIKIRKKNVVLSPEEQHDLLTIIYSLLRKENFRPFLSYLRCLAFASLNNYPILLEVHNVSQNALIEGCAAFYQEIVKKQRGKNKTLTEKLGFIGEIKNLPESNLYMASCILDKNYFFIEGPLRQLKLNLYLDARQVDYIKKNKACLRLNVKEGLNLIADVYALN